MKVNIGKLLMAVVIVIIAWLLFSLPMPSFGQPLVDLDGQPNVDKIAELAN